MVGATVFAVGCEDGPTQIFTPLPEAANPAAMNGTTSGTPWVEPGGRTFDDIQQGDDLARGSFCSEAERTAQVETMTTAPIIPNVSVGGVPLWSKTGGQVSVDDLVGRPSLDPSLFCEPTTIYSDAYAWGPASEILVLFDEETRLVTGLVAYLGYLGKLEGTYTNDAGEVVPVTLQSREHANLGGKELTEYSGRAEQATRPGSWLNHSNITAIYRMLRETYFNEAPLPDDFDCVDEQLCDVQYENADDKTEQSTSINFVRLGVVLRFEPKGTLQYVILFPVNVADFETAGTIQFGGANGLDFKFESQAVEGCALGLAASPVSWATFKDRCLPENIRETALNQAQYDVHTMRDAVDVNFNGLSLGFIRDGAKAPLKDGQRPDDDDRLYSVSFYRGLNAEVQEFNPHRLATAFARKLSARLRDAIMASGASTPAADHPFYDYSIDVPDALTDGPSALRELSYVDQFGTPQEFIGAVVRQIWQDYDQLTDEQRAMIDPRVRSEVYLIEPFVEAVLEAFALGAGGDENSFHFIAATDNERWSLGYLHFRDAEGVPYRLFTNYKLDQRAITAVMVERGQSAVDDYIDIWSDFIQDALGLEYPYYMASYAGLGGNPIGLDGTGIEVVSADRKLNMLTVKLDTDFGDPGADIPPSKQTLVVSGLPLSDRNGYLRQTGGESWEFVPANVVRLNGKETAMTAYVDESGSIEAVFVSLFKGPFTLCPGLALQAGDDVRAALEAYRTAAGDSAVRDCQVVFNYSENGNILDRVASLKYRRAITTTDGHATSAEMWR